MTVQFATFTEAEQKVVNKIVDRAIDDLNLYAPNDALDAHMDISAAHATCPLDLDRLLGFDDSNFSHDIWGIRRHLDRKTGKLQNFFLPRSAKPETEEE